MKDLISNFADHISDAINTIEGAKLKAAERPIHNVLITGLGGSGIGGTIVAELASPICSVPITVNKNYSIPAFVGENTLVIACSYSGNTEETLSATRQALSRKAMVACITSGGELHNIAQAAGLNVLTMRGGNPPRSMFAFSFSYLCYLLKHYNLIELDVMAGLGNAVNLINGEEASVLIEAEQLASRLRGKTPIVYAISGSAGIAARWRQQLNENAKMLAWEAEIPEMNHNELVGWEGGTEQYAPVFLRHDDDFDRNQKRIEIIKNIISEKTSHINELWSKGNGPIERTLYLVHFGDWVSYYLSEFNKVDIMDIKSIDLLKSELSKIPM